MADIRETNPIRFPSSAKINTALEVESLSNTAQDFLTCGAKKSNEFKGLKSAVPSRDNEAREN